MFELIESCPARREAVDWKGRFTSALTHLALVSAAVAATGNVTKPPIDIGVVPVATFYPTESPQPPVAGGGGGSPTLPIVAPIVVPPTIPDPGTTIPDVPPGNPGPSVPWTDPGLINPLGGGTPLGSPGAPLDERLVDEPPELLSHPALHYPDALRLAGIEGRVVVEVVLDTLGHAEGASLRVASSAHPMFEPEARSVVLGSRYRPARMAGRAVRVRILVPVNFQIRR